MTGALKALNSQSALTRLFSFTGEQIMLMKAYHTQKTLVNQEITPQNRLSMVPVGILATTILISAILHWLAYAINN